MQLYKIIRLYEQYNVFIKYCIIGIIVTVLDQIIFIFSYSHLGKGSLASKSLAFFIAFTLSFMLNRVWTFNGKDIRFQQKILKFLAMTLVGLAISLILIYVQIDLLLIDAFIANLSTSIIIPCWNFLANKLWISKAKSCHQFTRRNFLFDLSIVIPAYNEEARIEATILENIDYLSSREFSWEIVVVDDGSVDKTADIMQRYVIRYPGQLKLLRLPRNSGKGAAVQMGVINALGRYVIFCDADNATPINEVASFMAEANPEEVLIGSRYLSNSDVKEKQNKLRILIGRAGNLLIRFFLIDGIADTQCGFKLFPAEIAHAVFSRQRISGWGFDMEILSITQMMGIPIKEKGVVWRDMPGSRLRPVRDAFKTLIELARIKINLWSGLYE